MKRILAFVLFASLLVGCASSSSNKVNPLIKQYMSDHMANPETYKPGKTEVVEQGTIKAENTVNWQNISSEGDIDVVILRHEYSIVENNTNQPTDNAFIFYMSPEEDVIYYAHKDKGVLLFDLD